jgi:hypothetical protein
MTSVLATAGTHSANPSATATAPYDSPYIQTARQASATSRSYVRHIERTTTIMNVRYKEQKSFLS